MCRGCHSDERRRTVPAVKRLPELIKDRLAEMGSHGRPLSIRDAAARSGGRISHARLTQLSQGKIGQVSDRIVEGVAAAIDVPISTVYEALAIKRPFEPFRLPKEADRLSHRQRDAVLAVVKAMLDPGERQFRQPPAQASGGELLDDVRRGRDQLREQARRSVPGRRGGTSSAGGLK